MNLRNLQRALLASAVTMLAFSAAPAMAANTNFGACTGSLVKDCTAGTGHASVSVTSTLSINEMRAISFGNIGVSTPTTADNLVLGLDGTRTATANFTLLDGKNGGGINGNGINDTGSQSPGHYTISGGSEGNTTATQVYISFVDPTSGSIVDMCSPGGPCDSYHSGSKITMVGPTASLAIDSFVINESGSDVYGHYIVNTAGGNSPPGTTSPFLPNTGIAHGAATNAAGDMDVVVGATLHGLSPAVALTVGKYTGTFDIMASY